MRGWRCSLEGAWDSANTPYLELPPAGPPAVCWVEATVGAQVSEMGIYLYRSTDQFRLNRLADSQPVAMSDVPALVFSAVMRGVRAWRWIITEAVSSARYDATRGYGRILVCRRSL